MAPHYASGAAGVCACRGGPTAGASMREMCVMRWGPRTAPRVPISAARLEMDSSASAAELVELGHADCE
jgi:hypothetical protein